MFTMVQLARLTGDRCRDIDEGLRKQVLKHVKKHAKDANLAKNQDDVTRYAAMLTEIGTLRTEEQAQIFGESLPPALKLL